MREKIILDCDPGHDDAVAIILAVADEKLELLGITTVVGNTSLENATNNALRILNLVGVKDLEVYPGAGRPLIRDTVLAPRIHGYSGLEGAEIPEPHKKPSTKHAIDFMAEMIEKYPNEVTIVTTGPLTNFALFALKYPHLVGKIKSHVMMAGGIAFGNVTPVAEFNVFADPEAMSVVLGLDIPKVMAPLDLTHQAVVDHEIVNKIRNLGKEYLKPIADLLEFFIGAYKRYFGIDGAPLHDPCAVMYLIDRDMFEWEEMYVQVELKGELTYGQTVADIWHLGGKDPNLRVLKKIDSKRFFERLLDDLQKIGT
ncbi:MAG: nucleoside hydrolase [Thermotogae bacterium]|nr:nucleoside hydrolase [Thermotogota bacterium]